MRALRRVRRELRTKQVDAVTVPVSPSAGMAAIHGPLGVLRLQHATCLERALVMQRWLDDQGHPCEVIIGVSRPSSGFTAHAWLETDRISTEHAEHKEIMRLPAPSVRG